MIKIHDLFIGQFPISQAFGQDPETYKVIKDINGNPIKGHNGIDFATPTGVVLLNPFPKESTVIVQKVGFDQAGYGIYVKLWDKTQKCGVIYAHCQKVVVAEGAVLFFQQQVAISDATGWVTGPHCHVGYYGLDDAGNRTMRDNGYDGYQNLLDKTKVNWELFNPSKPADAAAKPAADGTVTITADTHTKLVTNSDNYQRVLQSVGITKRADDTPSEEVITKIAELRFFVDETRRGNAVLVTEIKNRTEQVARLEEQIVQLNASLASERLLVDDLNVKYDEAMKDKGEAALKEAAENPDGVPIETPVPSVEPVTETEEPTEAVAKKSLADAINEFVRHLFTVKW